MQKVWFITGCSTGFGRALAEQVLLAGHHAVVAARNTGDVADIVAGKEKEALAVQLDVCEDTQIKAAIKLAMDKFGRIDVLVNNAGIGYFGALEESEDKAVRQMFEVNVFGLGKMIQEVLPIMRAQRSGHILNIASIGGLVAFPALSYYNATKFAVDGLSEALAKEVAHLGIKVTIIAPSGFRTDWAGRSAQDSKTVISDYSETAGANKAAIRGYSGNQPGDPVRAAKAMIKVVDSEHPPLRLLLGEAALKNARIKLDLLKTDFDNWAETSIGADFPKA